MLPLVDVTETVLPLPGSLTVLPELSVMLTLALKLPELDISVPVQVNKQGELSVPLLTVACVQAIPAAVPGLTVTARPEPLVIEPSLTVSEVEPALTRVIAPFLPPEAVATPFVKLICVGVPKPFVPPAKLATVAWAPEGLSAAGPKVRLWVPA